MIVEAKWLKCDIFNSSKGHFSTVEVRGNEEF